ncbi:autolysin, partial [Listeria monocytogenes]|nr:autolysin [Listeria monocytogenes]HEM2272926.1 SH3-like domain-containing protein [Listeria monocytogenes]
WSAPYYSEGSTFISSATAPSYAKREAKTERGIYYQVKLGDKIIGWLDK